ncbi:MAG: polyprenyl synthetase family protein [Candidatus Sericytochromatia bacterium]|nr:polyprenyl synthetase family protein [Candidatus Tanganyikabacteria bacterium]
MIVLDAAGFRQGVRDRLSRSESAGAGEARRDLPGAVAHLRSGGKAVRAACARMVAGVFGAVPTADLAAFSEAVELLHLGTLIHDDILDEAKLRRGRPAVHVAYSTKVAVLAGDVAVSRAGAIIAALERPRLSGKFARVLEELCEGELLQDDHRWREDLTLAAYLDRVARKTGGLFELACEGAAALAGGAAGQVDQAARFGRELGVLFQVVDDLLDGAAPADLGKPGGQDLAGGLLTLVPVLALGDPAAGPPLRRFLRDRPGSVPPDLAAALGAPLLVARAGAALADLCDLARGALAELRDPSGSDPADMRDHPGSDPADRRDHPASDPADRRADPGNDPTDLHAHPASDPTDLHDHPASDPADRRAHPGDDPATPPGASGQGLADLIDTLHARGRGALATLLAPGGTLVP